MSEGYSKAGTTDGSNTIYYVLRDLSTAAVVICLFVLITFSIVLGLVLWLQSL